MYCTYVLTIASLKMFLRNRQALFFSLFMPMLILFIFGSINFDAPTRVHIGIVTHSPSADTAALIDRLKSAKTLDIDTGSLASELASLHDGARTAVLDVPDNLLPPTADTPPEMKVYINAGRPIEAATAMSFLHQFSDQVSLAVAHVRPAFTIKQESVDSHNFRYIDFLLPGIIAMSIMQMSVFSVAFVFTRYKEQGILKRLMATPMRPQQFVTANIITRLLMSFAQAAIFIAIGVAHFHVPVVGSYALLAVCIILGALMFLGLGFTISGLSKTVETVPVLANIVVFPMLFMGNIFFSSSNMAPWLQSLSSVLPLSFFSSAMRRVMTDGAGPADIHHDLLGMSIWAILLITLATLTFKFQDKEAA